MRLFPILLSLTLVACAGDDDPINAPPTGGGAGGGGGGVRTDAMASGIDGGFASISGQLCIVTDMRQPSASCASDIVFPELTITDTTSGDEVTTEVDGSFTIRKAAQDEDYLLQIGFNDDSYHNVIMGIGGNAESLTALTLDESVWSALLDSNGASEPTGTATIAAFAAVANVAAAGVTLSAPAGSTGITLYEGSNETDWDGSVTGPFGAGLMFGVPVEGEPGAGGQATFTAQGATSGQQTANVFEDAITFLSFNLL